MEIILDCKTVYLYYRTIEKMIEEKDFNISEDEYFLVKINKKFKIICIPPVCYEKNYLSISFEDFEKVQNATNHGRTKEMQKIIDEENEQNRKFN